MYQLQQVAALFSESGDAYLIFTQILFPGNCILKIEQVGSSYLPKSFMHDFHVIFAHRRQLNR